MTRAAATRWWTAVRLLVAAGVALVATLALAVPASAHAALLRTDPAPGALLAQAPDRIRLTFNEPMRLPTDPVRLFDAEGRTTVVRATTADRVVQVDMANVLAAGTHVLTWRAISTDGHPLSGSLTFSVGSRSARAAEVVAAADTSAAARRVVGVLGGVQYLGLLIAAGLAVFALLLPPGVASLVRRRLRAILRFSAGVAIAAAFALVPLAGVVKGGGGLGDLGSGASWDPDLVGPDLLAAALVAVGLLGPLLSSGTTRRRRLIVLLGVAVALVGPAMVGHTRSFDPEALLVVVDVVHLGAGAIWLGGMVGLSLVLAGRSTPDLVFARLLSRFSIVAATSLVVLVVMGSVLAWRILGSWAAVVGTTYGVLLLSKIALVAIAVGVAAVNRFLLLPRVRVATGTTKTLRRAVAVEAALLFAAVLVTGFLTQQAPHPATSGQGPQPTRTAQQGSTLVGAVRVVASLERGVVGADTLRLTTSTPTATPSVRMSSGSLALGALELRRVDANRYEAQVVLPRAGTWEVQVGIRLDAFENPVSTLTLPVTPIPVTREAHHG